MSKSAKKSRIQIEDLPIPEQELTPEMVQAVIGGVAIFDRYATAYGTHDYITQSSHWDFNVDDRMEQPKRRPRDTWA